MQTGVSNGRERQQRRRTDEAELVHDGRDARRDHAQVLAAHEHVRRSHQRLQSYAYRGCLTLRVTSSTSVSTRKPCSRLLTLPVPIRVRRA